MQFFNAREAFSLTQEAGTLYRNSIRAESGLVFCFKELRNSELSFQQRRVNRNFPSPFRLQANIHPVVPAGSIFGIRFHPKNQGVPGRAFAGTKKQDLPHFLRACSRSLDGCVGVIQLDICRWE
jgi:hypothetical protein